MNLTTKPKRTRLLTNLPRLNSLQNPRKRVNHLSEAQARRTGVLWHPKMSTFASFSNINILKVLIPGAFRTHPHVAQSQYGNLQYDAESHERV